MATNHWMSWEGGVDLVARLPGAEAKAGAGQPNVIVHVARMVHTPVGSAPAGMILWQPQPADAPVLAGFVSPDENVARYFGPRIFAGTPFEQAPALRATIAVTDHLPAGVAARVEVGGHLLEVELSGLGGLETFNRPPAPMTPFTQMVVEAAAKTATLKVDGKAVALTIPPIGITGGPAAVWSATGIYAR